MDDSTPIEPVIDSTPTGPTYDQSIYMLIDAGPTLEQTNPVAVSPYIATIEELVSTYGAIVQKENVDKLALYGVFQADSAVMKSALITWAALGFPADWAVFTAQTSPPVVCSDGQTRGFYEYVLYLLEKPIQTFLDGLNTQVLGFQFNFFLKDVYTIGLNVRRV